MGRMRNNYNHVDVIKPATMRKEAADWAEKA